MKLGWGATARRIYNVSYTNIDIVDAKWTHIGAHSSAIDVQLKITHPANPVVVSNVSWTNVTFENSNGVQRIAVELPLAQRATSPRFPLLMRCRSASN